MKFICLAILSSSNFNIEYIIFLFQILLSVDTLSLRLSLIDDELYQQFRAEFPNLLVDVLDEASIKSPEQKAVS
jgi:hypothetical protein